MRKLAADPVRLAGVVPGEALERLRAASLGMTGEARAELELVRRDGRIEVHGAVSAQVQLRCERCLEVVDWPLAGEVSAVLVGSADPVAELPQDLEPVLLDDDYLAVHELVEDELLLLLPIVARHAEGQCSPPVARNADGADLRQAQEVRRPFAGLRDLLDGQGED